MFTKILIASRGEIACRIARTCERLGIAAATIHSTADRDALHVRMVGESVEVAGAETRDSYLNAGAIIAAARKTGAGAVHPGIGFLSEDAGFARAVEEAGLVFIGPTADTLERLGNKWSAKREAEAAGIPVVAGAGASADPAEVARIVRAMDLPVMLKAIGGGGGRGVCIVASRDGLDEAIASAMREAAGAFGRPDLLVERFISGARHIEVQVAGDGRGTAIHLYERECSLQRRYQKVIEEAPAPSLEPGLRVRILDAARGLAERLRYRGLGTIEFLVRDDGFFFLEANPRLQVEHPATELITGLDLVELQLLIANGGALPLVQGDVGCSGHAIEARVYAEDPAAGFVPVTGVIRRVAFPDAVVRVDSGVEDGSVISPYYDPLMAKLIAHGPDRPQALDRLVLALRRTVLLGVATNLPFLGAVLTHASMRAGQVDNRFIDTEFAGWRPDGEINSDAVVAVAAAVWLLGRRPLEFDDPWLSRGLTRWRHTDGVGAVAEKPTCYLEAEGDGHAVRFSPTGPDGRIRVGIDGTTFTHALTGGEGGRYQVDLDDTMFDVTAVIDEDAVYIHGPFGNAGYRVEPYLTHAGSGEVDSGCLLAPMMGRIVKVHVREGDRVDAGDLIMVQESMKMEFRVVAPFDGVVGALTAREGDMVERNGLVAEISREPVAGSKDPIPER